jgi:hypothetical protein
MIGPSQRPLPDNVISSVLLYLCLCQQCLLQQVHSLICIQSKLAYMFRPIRPSLGRQSLRIPRIKFCENKQITLKVVLYHIMLYHITSFMLILQEEMLLTIQLLTLYITYTQLILHMATYHTTFKVICLFWQNCILGIRSDCRPNDGLIGRNM